MPREDPIIRKCCFCIPLQTCLQTWACTKVVLDLGLLFALAIFTIIFVSSRMFSFKHFNVGYLFLLVVLHLLVDGVFMVVLAVGLCMKNLRTIRVFYYYSLYMVIVGIIFFVGSIIFAAIELGFQGNAIRSVAFVFGALLNTGVDVGIIITLHSEMIKLRNKKQFEFVEMPTLKNDEDAESIQAS